MEEVTRSERHLRDGNGRVILDFVRPRRVEKRKLWLAAFICIFSVMVIMLAVTVAGKNALAAKLEDMTEMYNYQMTEPGGEDFTD